MRAERGGRSFDVEDDVNTASWQFWTAQFPAVWEPGTFRVLDEYLRPDRDFLDVGAWVGPFTLWAAVTARRVVAVEPDPVAARVLTRNVQRNRLDNDVTIVQAAVAEHADGAVLTSAGGWGDSMSSLVDRGASDFVEVDTVTLGQLLADIDPSVVKIDVEGGEHLIVPAIADLLDTGCPVILALHWPWISNPQPVRDVLARYTVTALDPHPEFPTVLVTP